MKKTEASFQRSVYQFSPSLCGRREGSNIESSPTPLRVGSVEMVTGWRTTEFSRQQFIRTLPMPLGDGWEVSTESSMKVQQFLEHHGINQNPFSQEDAQTDPLFQKLCSDGTFHPAWDKIYGDPATPSTSVVFGEKGSGKGL